MLHEEWSDYTEDEIKKIKKQKCAKCQYTAQAFGTLVCNYLEAVGKMRGVRPEDCNYHLDSKKTALQKRQNSPYRNIDLTFRKVAVADLFDE